MSLVQVCKRQALFLILCLHTGLTKKAPQTTPCLNEECNGLLQWTADGSDFLHLSQTTTDVYNANEACLIVYNGKLHDAPCDLAGLRPICMVEI